MLQWCCHSTQTKRNRNRNLVPCRKFTIKLHTNNILLSFGQSELLYNAFIITDNTAVVNPRKGMVTLSGIQQLQST